MYKKFLVFLFLLITGKISPVSPRGVNGGMSCAVCTVLMGVVLQVTEIREESFYNTTLMLCKTLPDVAKNTCIKLANDVEPFFHNISEKITPDLFCLVYGTCRVDEDQSMCHLFPLSFSKENKAKEFINNESKSFPQIDVCQLPVIDNICKILDNTYRSLVPAEDFDNDGFSVLATARGSDWKGKDCMDNDDKVYPGRVAADKDFLYDSNCNGIFGVNNETYTPWEELFCLKSKPRGLIIIGDSIGAHFHMPQVWINPVMLDWPGLNGSNVILDEIDWPQHSFATGFKNITSNILIKGPTDSLYLRLRSRNRCNHRDYQNLSKNGASSFEGVEHAKSVTRNQTTDNPAIVIYAMQGNDVCNNYNDTVNHMTKPSEFQANIIKTLNILNEKLPKNSHVILVGLVNGDVIFPAMANKLHPIGVLHKNVYYKDMYNWFNCLEIGPCAGWMNENETLRNITTQKAVELTNILKDIAKTEKFKFFNLHFMENPINIILETQNISVANLLEPVDSLHPNQNAQPLMADTIWSYILKNLPKEVLGPVNSYNQKIKRIFGDQGGH